MIRTRDLTKDFGPVHAVRGITLDIEPGELVAVLGPNGAGKTTTMRMLTTLIAPTSGSAEVAGHDVRRAPGEVRRRIGYVGQGNGAGHQHRVTDELHSQAAIYGLRRAAARARVAALADALDLGDLLRRKVSELSGGQRRRLDVAMGLVHAPKLLFLDEPSTGLDPQNRANLWEHILRMRAEHDMTIVLTTHYLDEADSMAERVVIVDHGEVIADDTAAALKTRLAGDRVSFGCAAPSDLAALVSQAPGAADVTVTGTDVSARVADGPAAVAEVLRAAFEKGLTVAGAQTFRPTLDDVFLSLTGRSLREENAK
ncbi:ATP-binding cassette domain-containing protein [Catenuloplanes atrovinosus]|uniref:ABC-2 type transport system ATP-binding protein n=1 Tax=Catenuloplanes atrovinosus TaxID=137266 RepID=A0AAE3YLZ7_9ACTN|nr:ATP-binding cassette domain-containing protein [Catenuloplanes atrovinosus]MDR7274900.1 ABC-2 type transport system ATP-binding protein [Catenuloplanes atrovinosus]